MALPADSHVHSEFSWDTGGPRSAAAGTMERTCARAVRIGLPAVFFTDHLDFTPWGAEAADWPEHLGAYIADGILAPPLTDFAGYFESIERCRQRFPDLQILTGAEFGQPHVDGDRALALPEFARLDRVIGSLHTLPVGEQRFEPPDLYRRWSPARVIEEYLAEAARMMTTAGVFEVFTHIDYAVRYWPTESVGPFDPRPFEEAFRHALRAVADSGRALELNVGKLLRPWIPQWWSEEGGRAITFGSDAHTPEPLAANFPEAMAMAEHFGFRPGRRATDFWTR